MSHESWQATPPTSGMNKFFYKRFSNMIVSEERPQSVQSSDLLLYKVTLTRVITSSYLTFRKALSQTK